MKKFAFMTLAVFALMSLTGCDTIRTIFEAGMWWAFFLVGAVIAVILWLFTRGKK